jgi:hypothetical protein
MSRRQRRNCVFIDRLLAAGAAASPRGNGRVTLQQVTQDGGDVVVLAGKRFRGNLDGYTFFDGQRTPFLHATMRRCSVRVGCSVGGFDRL